ncbi:TRAP transporter small permease [Paracoccus chinensis]|uniref:TRAP transporter small permease protein n=1 Tax=Paracoccus chinensis TaxID=525640 RepID=A0A1G9MD58_9RHOB|nr:TRAP transporter small permease [Paracoccus chinensis]SDL72196.1 TRAP-type C4-dicarboxylate transport system, small permease component [Paracoccus chinensis]
MKAIERVMLEFAVVSTLALALAITANVAGRQLFGWSVPDIVIIVRELMIPTIILPLAAATANRAHIAVTFVTDRMSPRARGRLIVFGWFVALLAMLPLIYASWRNLSGSWSSGEFYDGLLGIPRWPMKLVFLLGLVMMTIRLVLVALEDLAELQRTGTVTIQSHTEEESV